MSDMVLMHGGGKPLDLNDPVDQVVVACLCVPLLCVIAMFFVAVWRPKTGIGVTPACPECNATRVSLRGIVAGESQDWDVSDPPGWKWRCKVCGAEFETMRGAEPKRGS